MSCTLQDSGSAEHSCRLAKLGAKVKLHSCRLCSAEPAAGQLLLFRTD